jgi:hypothetical protein
MLHIGQCNEFMLSLICGQGLETTNLDSWS